MLAVTATASSSQRRRIRQRLGMKKVTEEIIENPDRPNIQLSLKKVSSVEPGSVTFQWLLDQLQLRRHLCPRFVVFCRSVSDCSNLYFTFKCALDAITTSHCNMYHSKTPDDVKEMVRAQMAHSDSDLRVLFCTSAAGMGVNFANINNVVHYGPPREMDTLLQQIGRAGRDGTQSFHLLIYSARQLRMCEKEVLDYVRNQDQCRRTLLLKSYKAQPDSQRIRHACCDICSPMCNCGNVECSDFVMEGLNDNEDSDTDEDTPVPSEGVKNELKSELVAYRDSIYTGNELSELWQGGHLYGFTDDVIDFIVDNCHCLLTPDDVYVKCHIFKFDFALQVAIIINRVLHGCDPDWDEHVEVDEFD